LPAVFSKLKRFASRALWKAGYEVFNARMHHARDGLFTRHRPTFLTDPTFLAHYGRGVLASHGVDPGIQWRLHVALWAADLALRVPGDFVECGVNAGFMSSAIMRHLNWHTQARRYYLVDTFAGPVLDQFSDDEVARGRAELARDAVSRGAYVTDLARIAANFAEWPNVHIVPGVIPEILPSIDTGRVAFLHIDLNCAAPECAALRYFWDRLPTGAVVLLDDYCYQGHEAQAIAIDAVARELGVTVLALPTGQGLIVH